MSYLIGNIIGRLIGAYLLVFVANFLLTKFKYKLAISKTHSVYGGVSIAVIMGLGLLLSAAKVTL